MDWRFVWSMGAMGLIVGILNLFGWLPTRFELPVWLALGTIWVVAATRTQRKAPFQHVFMASLVAGFLSADVPAIFFNTFLANNPDLAVEAMQNMTANGTALPATGGITRVGLILAGIVWGILFGMLTGATALLAVRLTDPAKKQGEDEDGPEVAPAFGAHMDLTHPGRDERAEQERAGDDSEE